ncbi:50S ribosomal protein L24 [Flavobacteriaceae bacterium Ap0902]|nr:50S ribosomal protein L24 [Flavobacteriaceae bacterium Ap0902]
MTKFKIKNGDNVIVLAGREKGKTGEIVRVIRSKSRVVIQGVNTVKKHTKPSATNPQGGIVEQEAPIHISNVAIVDPDKGTPTRVGYKMDDGKKVRFAKKSGKTL